MNIDKQRYKKLMILVQKILKKIQLPLYAKKFSKKEFTTHQLLFLLVLKTYENKGYRTFIEYLHISKIPELLRLKKIPHFTTLQKFSDRINIQKVEQMIKASALIFSKPFRRVGLDATGFSMDHASIHYAKRIGRVVKRKDFLKTAFISDLDNQLILAVKTRKRARHDTKDFLPLWNKVKKLDFNHFFADKGYDDNKAHQEVFESGRRSVIFLRRPDVPIHRTKGVYRKKAKRIVKYQRKGKRSITETINFVVKNCFGPKVYARKLKTQKLEILLKALTYNLRRISIINKKINFALQFLVHQIRLFINLFFKQITSMP